MDLINILWILLISFGINYFFFIFAWLFKSDVFTDITYALSFSVLMIIFLVWKQNFNLNQILVFVLVNLWALRLGSYLFKRIIKIKVDHRFDTMRNSFWKFGAFWTFQALTVFITILPAAMLLTIDANLIGQNNWLSLTSIILLLSLFGLIFETIGDQQKNIFYNKKSLGKVDINEPFIKTGLWKITRHPNYFGELCFWYGITFLLIINIIISSNNSPESYLSLLFLLSPIYLNISLIYISGIRLLERKEKERFKDNIAYSQYIKNTSMMIPFVGKKGEFSMLKKKNF